VKRIMNEVRNKVAGDVAVAPLHDSFFTASAQPGIAPTQRWKQVSGHAT
jgi:hypothetical protein